MKTPEQRAFEEALQSGSTSTFDTLTDSPAETAARRRGLEAHLAASALADRLAQSVHHEEDERATGSSSGADLPPPGLLWKAFVAAGTASIWTAAVGGLTFWAYGAFLGFPDPVTVIAPFFSVLQHANERISDPVLLALVTAALWAIGIGSLLAALPVGLFLGAVTIILLLAAAIPVGLYELARISTAGLLLAVVCASFIAYLAIRWLSRAWRSKRRVDWKRTTLAAFVLLAVIGSGIAGMIVRGQWPW